MKTQKHRSLRSLEGCNGDWVPRKGHILSQRFKIKNDSQGDDTKIHHLFDSICICFCQQFITISIIMHGFLLF